VILVTLGTHPQPMDRLIVGLDRLLASGELNDEVIITAAAYGQRPSLARGLGIQPFDVLTDMARTAKAIITHGGPASIALALSAGHSPVVVPRNPALREHVDDHQLRFAAWLAERRDITVVLEMDTLGDALREALARQADRPRNPPVPAEAITRLRAILASGG
jgi:UDP-N-acetylglucosamine transferase subunit ALG13